MNSWMNFNNQKIQLEKILFIHLINQVLIKAFTKIKVLILWPFKIINTLKKQKKCLKRNDIVLF